MDYYFMANLMGGAAAALIIWVTRERIRSSASRTRRDDSDILCMKLIREICAREAWTVELCGDNPEFDSSQPNSCVTVFGDWRSLTQPDEFIWGERTFRAGSVLECLQIAVRTMYNHGV